jgi:hypothetical protein
MSKIAVIGSGTAGCFASLRSLRLTNSEIDWYYDSKIPTAPVGEGTTMTPLDALRKLDDWTWREVEEIGGTCKQGISKKNWGKSGKRFLHSFPAGGVGMHFDAGRFQNFMFDRLSKDKRVVTIDANLKNPEELDADYIIDCSGNHWRDNEPDVKVTDIPVNRALVVQCDPSTFRESYTMSDAMPYGWCFVIPLRERIAVGYVHSKDFGDIEERKVELEDYIRELNLHPISETRTIDFDNYYRTKNFGRVSYLGNSSAFLEPLEATATTTLMNGLQSQRHVMSGNYIEEFANVSYVKEIENVISMICLHYLSGSVYDTPFWKHAQYLALKRYSSIDFLKSECYPLIQSALYGDLHNTDIAGTWSTHSYMQNIEGLGLKQRLQEIFQTSGIMASFGD